MQQIDHLIAPGHSFHSITETISGIVLRRSAPKAWFALFALGLALLALFGYAVWMLLVTGTGVWGVNQPVGWGFDITNLVWWIGIAHAGTLISAILLLFQQQWRTSINRFAEAMTLFALLCAQLFPILHTGRPWLAYWIFPYPNTLGMWPQFRSPLTWDAFAILAYATVSFLFWGVGLLPDLAVLRDHAHNRWVRYFYAVLALGWRGDAKHWQRLETINRLLAGLATALVVVVSSVLSLDFASGLLPGWHSTIFPPYFVAGGIFCGVAMVLVLLVPLRKIYGLEGLITLYHLDNLAKIVLAVGLFVAYSYVAEAFTAWFSGNPADRFWLSNRSFGPYAWAFWTLILCNVLIPQLLWSAWVRAKPWLIFLIALGINIGMWLERYTIIVVSLHRDFLPSSWGMYAGSFWDWAIFLGTIGLFLTMIALFVRLLPMISIFEMRHLLAESKQESDLRPSLRPSTIHPSAVTTPIYVGPASDGRVPLYGLLAEFDNAYSLRDKAHLAYVAGYRKLEAYSPFPVAGLPEALGMRRSRLPLLVLLGGIFGGAAAFAMQYYAAVIDYPWNIGGRPLNSWPSFLILTLELTILFAAGAGVLGMLLRNGFPQLYHSLFNEPRFLNASKDRFFLCIESKDPQFALAETRQFLEGLGAVSVVAVER